ncbi:MAG: type II secretion system protein GspD [Candidatus Omnitrophica bacterium]|nr:type II secretion system protein GspD [Candidatus Omnitrophota bacterium]
MYWLLVALITGQWALGAAYAQNPASTPPSGLTAEKISLDLKGVDILDVLKLLSQKSGLNFIAGRNVTGRVTIFAKEVGVWEAFERIVDANDLAYELRGAIVNVMTARDYELLYGERFQERKKNQVVPLKFAKANQVATVLSQVKSNLGRVVIDEASNTVILNDLPSKLEEMAGLIERIDRPTETRIYALNYAEAEKVREKIQEFLTPGIGLFSFDARTNKVVISDLQPVMTKIDQLIQALDEREREVLIEAKIIKVELSDDQSLGIDWQQAFDGVDTRARGSFRVLGDIVGAATPATGGALKYISATDSTQIVLEALKKFGKVDTISNPRITVANNQEAKILVGKKEAIVTVTTTLPASGPVVSSPQIQFVDVGTKLFVTPSIKRDGHVQLKIRPEVSDATIETFQTNRIPIVSTTEAETNVLVKSGTTLVIGGLIDSKRQRTQSQLPILGDIPVIGAAFRSRVDSNKKTELVVFLTPQIILSSGERVTDFTPSAPVHIVQSLAEEAVVVPEGYQLAVREQVTRRLAERFRASGVGASTVELSFVLAADGRLLGEPDVTSQQGESLVGIARAALKDAAPFPAFPKDVRADRVRFRVAVDYQPAREPARSEDDSKPVAPLAGASARKPDGKKPDGKKPLRGLEADVKLRHR